MADNKENLYKKLKEKGLYTKSFDDFKSQFSTREKAEKLYSGLNQKGLYTKSVADFNDQFFPELKKKGPSAPVSKNTSGTLSTPSATFQNIEPAGIIPEVDTTVPTPLTDKGAQQYLAEQTQPGLDTTFSGTLGNAIGENPLAPSNPELINSQGIGGKQILDSSPEEQRGGFGGYTWNEFLKGAGSMAAGTVDAGLNYLPDAINFTPSGVMANIGERLFGIENPYKKDEAKIADFRANDAEQVRNFLKDKIGADVDDETVRKYQEGILTGAIGGLAGSIPAMAGTAFTGNIVPFFMQGYDSAMQSLDGKDLDPETKTLYSLGNGYVNAQLEKVGFDRIFPGLSGSLSKAILNKSIKEAADKTAGKVTGNVLDKYIDENLKGLTKRFAKFGSKALDGFVTEFATGVAQEGANIGSEYLLNATTGKPVFDTEDMSKWEGFTNNLERVGKSGLMEGIGGGIMGGLGSVANVGRKKVLKEKTQQLQLAEAQLNSEKVSPQAKALLLQRKLNLEQEIEQEVIQEAEEQKKLPEAKVSQMKLLAEKIDEIDSVLQDPDISADVKASLQQEFDSTVQELEAIQNEEIPETEQEQTTIDTPVETPVQETPVGEQAQVLPEIVDEGVGEEQQLINEDSEINTNFTANEIENQISQQLPQANNGSGSEVYSKEQEFGNRLGERVRETETQLKRPLNQHEREDLERQSAFEYARENEIWTDNFLDLGDQTLQGGNENSLVVNRKDLQVYKSNNLLNSNNSIAEFLKGIEAHNRLFPSTKYELVGFTGHSRGKVPYVEPIIRQDYIPNASQASQAEIESHMESLGFKKVNEHTFSNEQYTVSDLRPRNVLKDEEGNIHVIDDIVRENETTSNENHKKSEGELSTSINESKSLIEKDRESVNKIKESGIESTSQNNDNAEITGQKVKFDRFGEMQSGTVSGTDGDKISIKGDNGINYSIDKGDIIGDENGQKIDWDNLLHDNSSVQPALDFLDKLKIKQGNTPFSKVLPVVELYNAAIDVIKVAIKAGNTLRKAINMAADYLKEAGATEEQITGFKKDVRERIQVDNSESETIKQTIKSNTDFRSKSKVVMNELAAIKKQFKDFERGFKEGVKEGKQDARQQQAAYDAQGQQMRQKLLDVLQNIKELKLFNGHQISQNGMVNMIKTVLDAGNNPRKLDRAADAIIKRLEIIDYDNKVADAKKDINYLKRQYFKGNQKEVSKFLSILPENVPLNEFYNYLHALQDLKNHLSGVSTISNFGYINTMANNYNTINNATNANIPHTPQTPVTFEKPTESFKEKMVKGWDKFKRNWLDYRRGMPENLYQLKEKMIGRINVEVTDAMNEAKRLEGLLSKNQSVKIEDVDAALRGDQTAMNGLPQEIGESVINMRGHIDRISNMMIDEGLVKDTQKATIEVNLGEYLNRSYELFNNKEWTLENLPEPLYNRAFQLLFDQYYPDYVNNNPNMAQDEVMGAVKNRVEAKIREYFDKDSNQFFNQKNNGAKDLSIMMQRADIPIELRELFGERKDPIYNYLNTIHKMATFSETAKYLRNVRDASLGTLMWEKNDPNRPAEAFAMIAAEGSETMDSLNGLYTTKEIAEAFNQTDEQVSKFFQVYLKAIGAVKAGKTVGSIITHIKNVEGNIGFVLSNGHLPFIDGSKPDGSFIKAMKMAFADVGGYSNKEIQDFLRPLIENNIIGQSVGANEIKNMFDPNTSNEATFERLFARKKTVGEKAKGVLNKIWGKTTALYQAEDDWFKIYGYLSDMQRYSKAIYGKEMNNLDADEKKALTEYVAEMVKNTYPTFSRVPKIARVGSMYLPFFGNFVSFQAESYRVGYNLWKQAFTEIKSDNPALRQIGISRAIGLTTYTGLKNGLIAYLGSAGIGGLMGLLADDDEEKQKRSDVLRYVAPFSKNSDVIALPIKNDELQYVDVSSYDPFGSQSKIINAVFNNQSFEDGFVESIVEATSPFVDREITAGMLFDLARNEDVYGRKIFNPEDDAYNKGMDIGKFVGKVIEPGVSSWTRRLITGGDSTGEVKALAYRTYKSDIPQQFTFKMRDYKIRLDNIEDIYKKEYYDKDSTPESRLEAYGRANNKKKDVVKEMHEDYMAAIRLGIDESKLIANMADMRMAKYLRAAIITGNTDIVNVKDREGIVPKSRQGE